VKEERRRLDRIGWLVFGVTFSVLAGITSLRFLLVPPATDDDMCLVDEPLVAHTVILVDRTDALSGPGEAEKFRAVVNAERNRLKTFERVSIYLITETTGASPILRFSRCNPLRGDQVDPLYRNPRLIQRQYDESFSQPLDRVVSELMEPGVAPRSPIIESIGAITRTGEFSSAVPARRLVIVSDLIEHTQGFSHYKRCEGYESIYSTAPYSDLRVDLAGATVAVFQIARSNVDCAQGSRHSAFWMDFFARSGAVVTAPFEQF